MTILVQCCVYGKELKFSNLLEYNKAIRKSGPDVECDECQLRGGPEHVGD